MAQEGTYTLYLLFQIFKPDLTFVILRKKITFYLKQQQQQKSYCMVWQVDIQSSLHEQECIMCSICICEGTVLSMGD